MGQLLLMSLLIGTIIIPIRAAREKSALRGLKKTVYFMAGFVLLYAGLTVFVYLRIS